MNKYLNIFWKCQIKKGDRESLPYDIIRLLRCRSHRLHFFDFRSFSSLRIIVNLTVYKIVGGAGNFNVHLEKSVKKPSTQKNVCLASVVLDKGNRPNAQHEGLEVLHSTTSELHPIAPKCHLTESFPHSTIQQRHVTISFRHIGVSYRSVIISSKLLAW